MKKIFLAVSFLVSIMLIVTSGALAASSTKHTGLKSLTDNIHDITLPVTVDEFGVVKKETVGLSYFCDSDRAVPVNTFNVRYFYTQYDEYLTTWNVGKVSLSGQNVDGMLENLSSYLSFDTATKSVDIAFAYQTCSQIFTPTPPDPITGKITCTITDEICGNITYNLKGKVVLIIEPYIGVSK